MARSVWELFLALFRGGEDTEPEADEEDEGRFVPSPMDLSVRIGHGGSEDERLRELAEVNERARELEEEQRSH